VGTANPACVYWVDEVVSDTASFTSDVLDAKFVSSWGQISWSSKGTLSIQSRTGNSSVPDDTWSEWSTAQTASPAMIKSSPGRFIQVKVNWTEPDAVLRWIMIHYLRQNQLPQIKELTVEGADQEGVFQGKAKESTELSVKWKAEDPDGDQLIFWVYYRKDGQDSWILANKNDPLEKKEFKWNTTYTPDGWYSVKIIASDEKSNPQGNSLKQEKTTKAILVDNGKPMVSKLTVNGRVVTGVAEDSFSFIARVEYSLDGKEWRYVYPKDKIFDQTIEPFEFILSDVPPGQYPLTLKVFDAAGNVCVYQVITTIELAK
jgi:hypothetical protein